MRVLRAMTAAIYASPPSILLDTNNLKEGILNPIQRARLARQLTIDCMPECVAMFIALHRLDLAQLRRNRLKPFKYLHNAELVTHRWIPCMEACLHWGTGNESDCQARTRSEIEEEKGQGRSAAPRCLTGPKLAYPEEPGVQRHFGDHGSSCIQGIAQHCIQDARTFDGRLWNRA